MDGRDAFLTMARERHYEFSSFRRAKFSSMAMLYELHTQSQDKFVYTCNNCKKNVETRYHCSTCDVSTCYCIGNWIDVKATKCFKILENLNGIYSIEYESNGIPSLKNLYLVTNISLIFCPIR